MKKIIDASALRSSKLEAFLSASVTNRAVLTDYAAMESFKGDGRVNARKSLEILARFPKQVIVLKSTGEIVRLQPRQKGLHSRLIDERQTRGFQSYCNALLGGRSDQGDVDYDLSLKTSRARSHFDQLSANTSIIREGIAKLASSYSASDLKLLRSRQHMPQSFADRLVQDVLVTAAIFFRDAARFNKLPPLHDAMHSFPLRYALCAQVVTVKWIAEAGHDTVSSKKLQNDYTDMTYAAYATFFDGIITNDHKLDDIYTQAKWLLTHVFPGHASNA